MDARIAESQHLLELMGEQKNYVSKLVNAAKKYHFAERSHDGRGGESCPSKEQCGRNNILYLPSEAMLYTILGAVILFTYRLFCSANSHVRKGLAIFNGIVGSLVVMVFWNWSHFTNVQKFNTIGRISFQTGRIDDALSAFDVARCEIWAHPFEASILIEETALETFMGAALAYTDADYEDGNLEGNRCRSMMDELLQDVDDLIVSHIALKPSFSVAAYYLSLSEFLHRRGDSNGHSQSQRYQDLAERETRRLAQYMEEMMEEEVEKMTKGAVIGKRRQREAAISMNKTATSMSNEENEEGQFLEVHI